MKNANEDFNDNINEVINYDENTDFTFFVQNNNSGLVKYKLPIHIQNKFIIRFGEDIPDESEFNKWIGTQCIFNGIKIR